jgi:ATP-dependent Zn protease
MGALLTVSMVNANKVVCRITPPEASFIRFKEESPQVIQTLGIAFFVFFCVAIGVFRSTRNRQPQDLQEALEFAQSKATARKDGTTSVTLDDVAGLSQVKHEFEEIVDFLKNPKKYKDSGIRAPKGILLEGPPGTGKTLIAKAIAGEAQVGFYQMSGSEFVETIVGVGAARVRDLFKRARAYEDPTLIFVDEIDALAFRRAEAGEEANEEREQVCPLLLL